MEMVIQLLLLALGFFMLVKGADWFVDGSSGIADKLRASSAGDWSDDCGNGNQRAGGGSQHYCSLEGQCRDYNRKHRRK